MKRSTDGRRTCNHKRVPSYLDPDEVNQNQNEDWLLLQNGPASFVRKIEILDELVSELRKLGYVVHRLQAGAWQDDSDMHDSVASAFSFPTYYGRNWPALSDCLSDVAGYAYGSDPDSAGTVVVLEQFSSFQKQDRESADGLVQELVEVAWRGLLFGHRVITLVQVDETHPEISLSSQQVHWNRHEWPTDRR